MSDILNEHPDLKFLKEHKLLNDNLIITLINDRRLYSQQATIEGVTEEECMKQIKIELNLLDIFKLEINKNLNLNQSDIYERNNILSIMTKRIEDLYINKFKIFPIEYESVEEYFKFQVTNKSYTTDGMTSFIISMTRKKCPPKLYSDIATLEYRNKNMNRARLFFSEGKKNHEHNQSLYLDELLVECKHLDDTNGNSFETALQTYRNAVEIFKDDMEFHIKMLDASIVSKSITKLQYTIVRELVIKYHESDVMWKKIATLADSGFIYIHGTNLFDYTENDEYRAWLFYKILSPKSHYIVSIIASGCIYSYKAGLKNVPGHTNKHSLLILFTDYAVQLWKKNASKTNPINTLANNVMAKAFWRGHVEFGGIHNQEYYVYWAVHKYQTSPAIVKLAIDNNKHKVNVWAEVLRFNIKNFGSLRMAKKIFDAGNLALENQSMILYEIVEPFWQKTSIKELTDLYTKGAYSPYEDINSVYRVKYLKYKNNHEGITSTRELFNRLADIAPDSRQLYTTMIEIEKLQVPLNFNVIRNLHRLMCMKFGLDDISVWIDSIHFELKIDSITNADNIYVTAMDIVKPFSKKVLKREYDFMKEDFGIYTPIVDPVVIDLLDESRTPTPTINPITIDISLANNRPTPTIDPVVIDLTC